MDLLKVRVVPDENGEVPPDDVLLDAAKAAGWSMDPGTGKSIRWNGGEIFNPMPHALPIGYVPEDSIEVRIQKALRDYREAQDVEIDDIVDAEDFDVPDELPDLSTIYEFVAMDKEVPAPPPTTKSARELAMEKVQADLDLEDMRAAERGRRAALRAAKPIYGDIPEGEGGR